MEGQQSRPARKQVDSPVTGLEHSNDTAVYNIWDHRRQKGHRPPREGRGVKERSQYRCHASLDSGWTRGERSGCEYFCIYFARGICHHGHECNFLHRIPSQADEARHRAAPQYDIFGRDRLAEATGTKGVGTYSRDCTTLYIYLGGAATQPASDLQKAMEQDFAVWGPMEAVNVVPSKAIGFVRYAWRSSSEFAKAAMHQQTLNGIKVDHVLDVRWANDDPNPKAQDRTKRGREEAMAQAYLNTLEGMGPEEKRARLQKLSLSAAYRPGGAASEYPDTEEQFEQRESAEGRGEGAAVAVERGFENALVAQYEKAIWGDRSRGGDAAEEEDDIERYLPAEGEEEEDDFDVAYDDELTVDPGAEGERGGEKQQPQQNGGPAAEMKQQQQEKTGGGSGGGKVDNGDALGLLGGLLGGYGSGSDDGE